MEVVVAGLDKANEVAHEDVVVANDAQLAGLRRAEADLGQRGGPQAAPVRKLA